MPLSAEAQEMAKAEASSDFIKQVTAAEAESQGAAAQSPCCPSLSSSSSPPEAHALSGQWAGVAAGAVLEVSETKKEVLSEEGEDLKLYNPQELSQVELNEDQSWSARKEKTPLSLTHQAWSEYWGFNNGVSDLSSPPLSRRETGSTLTLIYEPPWEAVMMDMRTTATSTAADTESQEAAIHRPCWSPPSSSTSSQLEVHVLRGQKVRLAAGAPLPAPVTEAEALAKTEEDWEDNRDQQLSQGEDSTEKNWNTEEESLPMLSPHKAWEEHWVSQLHTPTSAKLDLPRWIHNRPSYDMDLSRLDWEEESFFNFEGNLMCDMRERITSKETAFWEEELMAWNRRPFERMLLRSSPPAVPTPQASFFRRALGALCWVFQCPCLTRQPEL